MTHHGDNSSSTITHIYNSTFLAISKWYISPVDEG